MTLTGSLVHNYYHREIARAFGPIILEYKKRGDYYKHVWENFEYLAYELSKAMVKADPEYKMPEYIGQRNITGILGLENTRLLRPELRMKI